MLLACLFARAWNDGATDRNRTCIAGFGGPYPIRWKTVALCAYPMKFRDLHD
jgi:hypothetical protein